jgi:glutamate dehydrogenase (NADP+)
MADEYQTIKRVKAPGVITGKPVGLGGSPGREEATGRGAFVVVEQWLRRRRLDPRGLRVAVQGFGNAAYPLALLLQQAGARVVAISDSKGGIYSERGFDVESVHGAKRSSQQLHAVYCHGSVCEQVEHQSIDNEALLELDVDLLVPAALEGVITAGNAARVRARAVAEVANGPVSGDADPILQERGIEVLPDVLVNAGGVVVSYFEWVQNRQGWAWSLDEVRGRLAQGLTGAFERIWQVHESEKLPLRGAAYAVALRRLAAAIEAGGTQHYFQTGS